MFYKSLISEVNNEQILYLYFENNYEFSNEFNDNGILNKNIIDTAKSYINNNKIPFYGNSVYLVSQGIIFGSINLNYNTANTYIPIPEKIEIIDVI